MNKNHMFFHHLDTVTRSVERDPLLRRTRPAGRIRYGRYVPAALLLLSIVLLMNN